MRNLFRRLFLWYGRRKNIQISNDSFSNHSPEIYDNSWFGKAINEAKEAQQRELEDWFSRTHNPRKN